jgi:hypothetical protein
MAKQQDIIGIANGDFEVGEDTAVRFRFAMNSGIGHWLQYPLQGADIPRLENAKVGPLTLESRVIQTLSEDGWTRVSTPIINGVIQAKGTPPEV